MAPNIEDLKARSLILVPGRMLKAGDRFYSETLYEGIVTIEDVKHHVDGTVEITHSGGKKLRLSGDTIYRYNEEKDCLAFLSRYYLDLIVDFAKVYHPSAVLG